jgi:hypothetical protein
MIVNKKFLFVLLMIFFDLNLKFIHGTKKKTTKNIKRDNRGLKNNIMKFPIVIPTPVEERLTNENSMNKNKDKDSSIENLFEINEDIFEKGSDFLFLLKESNEIFNKEEDADSKKINIGNLSIPYAENTEDYKKNNEANDLQKFIENYGVDLLILFVIKSFLIENNINILVENKIKITQTEVKFRRKYFKKNGYKTIKLLEKSISMYKKILLMLILNILDENNADDKKNIFNRFIDMVYSNNLFYNNDLLKKKFIFKLKEIEDINKNFNVNDFESIIYFLAYYIKEQPDSFFELLDKETLKLAFFIIDFNSSDLKDKDKNLSTKSLEEKKLEEAANNNDSKIKENIGQEMLKIKEFSGIMKYYLSILTNLVKS